MSSIITANNGTQIDLDNVELTFAYSGSFLMTITIVYAGETYVQTFTNNGTNITVISNWVVQ